jgi:hypothetical protein
MAREMRAKVQAERTAMDVRLALDGRDELLAQDAVDAVSDPHHLLVRLDVNVARAHLDGVEQNGVHEAHDGGVGAGEGFWYSV